MPMGTVKWFDRAKGYGFITVDETGREIFVHYADIEMDGFRLLREGQRVTCEIEESDRPQARNVVPERRG